MASKNQRAIHPIHPGKVLADELTELGMSAAELARTLRVPYRLVHRLVSGQRAMTADTALRLQQWVGVSADFWMNLQKRYERDVAAEAVGAEIERAVHRNESLNRAGDLEISVVSRELGQTS